MERETEGEKERRQRATTRETELSRAQMQSFNFSFSAAHDTWSEHTDEAVSVKVLWPYPTLPSAVISTGFKHKSVCKRWCFQPPSALAGPTCWCSADILFSMFSILVWTGAANRLGTNRVLQPNQSKIKVFTVHLAGNVINIYIYIYFPCLRRVVTQRFVAAARKICGETVAGKHIFVSICRHKLGWGI